MSVHMIESIKLLLPNTNPRYINNLDFEQADTSAITKCFPDLSVIGCFFHMMKLLKKRLVEMGFTSSNGPDFAMKSIALANVPIADL